MTAHFFDFTSYLENFTGAKGWHVEVLPGGAANFTVRAVRRSSTEILSDESQKVLEAFKSDVTVVIKQAPPFLAKSPQVPFSSYRQTIESLALQTFHFPITDANGLHSILLSNPRIRIPKLLLLDTTNSIMVQSDLGRLPNLYDILRSPQTSRAAASQLGQIIGQFLADMHNPAVISPTIIDKFHNSDAERVMEAAIMQATEFMQDANLVDAHFLGDVAMEHWRTRKKTVFTQGDLWFGTILVNQKKDVFVGICDWEFAGPNDPAADIAQLGSYLHLLSIGALTTPSEKELVVEFAVSLYSNYYGALNTPPDAHFLKSFMILHGWEMINAAGWDSRQSMWCSCRGKGVKCKHIESMIEEAARFLRAANDLNIQSLKDIYWSRFLPRGAG